MYDVSRLYAHTNTHDIVATCTHASHLYIMVLIQDELQWSCVNIAFLSDLA
jgi:hypothetical protein